MIRSFADKMKAKQAAYDAEQKILAEQAEQARIQKEEERWNKEWEAKKAEEARIVAEELHQKQQERLEEQERQDNITRRRIEEWELEKQEQLIIAEHNKKLIAEEKERAMERYIARLSETLKPKKKRNVHEGMPANHESTWQLTWKSFSTHPKIINLPMSEKVRLFKLAQSKEIQPIIQPTVLGNSSEEVINYALSFTGDTGATARADLVRTDFTPNDPTNKGFSSSDRTPLAKSGFTISYWYRPDEQTGDAFAMGIKITSNARFSFGMRNAARPYFGIGSNTFGTYGTHNAWYNMFNDSGNTDLTDKYIDENDNLIADGSKWYHIAITFTGREPGGTAIDSSEWYRRIYFNGKQIFGYNSEAIGTAYETYHNVDHPGDISWPEGDLDEQLTRGFSFGMRALEGSGAVDGISKAKYNNGHACGLSEVAIYNELKLDEGSGNNVKDYGPYGYHGTLTNAKVGEGVDITVQNVGEASIGAIAEGTPTWFEHPNNYGHK